MTEQTLELVLNFAAASILLSIAVLAATGAIYAAVSAFRDLFDL